MTTILAQRTDTAVPVSVTVNNSSGGIGGLTVAVSVFDPAAAEWLDFNDNSWSATPVSQTTPATGTNRPTGNYGTTVNISNRGGTISQLHVFYAISGAVTYLDMDVIQLSNSWRDIATATGQTTMQGNVTDILADTSTYLDAAVSTRAVPGSAMTLSAGAVTDAAIAANAITAAKIATDAISAAKIATDAVVEIQTGLATAAALSTMQGNVTTIQNQTTAGAIRSAVGLTTANLDTQLASLATAAALTALEAHGDLTWSTADVSALATLAALGSLETHGDATWSTATGFAVAGDDMGLTAQAIIDIWDKLRSSYAWQAGSFGQFLDALVSSVGGGSLTVQDIVDGVWDETRVPNHTGAGTFGGYLDSPVSSGVGGGLDAQGVRDAMLLSATGGEGPIDTKLNTIDGKTLNAAGVRSAIGLASANLDTQLAEGDYLGKIWIDTVNGTPGTVVGTNGTSRNPVSTLADARTLSASTGLKNFFIRNGAVTFITSHTNEIWEGNLGARITFANQDCAGSMFKGITLYGVAGGTGDIYAQSCVLDTVSGGSGVFKDCLILTHFQHRNGAFCDFDRCRSFAGFHNVNNGRIRWNGHNGYTLFTNMENVAHTQEIYSEGGLANFDASNTGGTINFTGPADWYRDGGDNLSNGIVHALLTDTLYNQIFNIQGPSFGATFDPTTDSLEAIRDRGDAAWADSGAIDAQGVRDAVGLASANLDTQLASKATAAAVAALPTAAQNADAVWNEVAAEHTGLGTFGDNLDAKVSLAGSGGLTLQGIIDGIWDEVLAGNHDGAGSASAVLQSASVGGVDLDLLTSRIWNAALGDFQSDGSMGQAQATAAATETIRQLLNSAIGAVRRYGPVLVAQPLAGRDEVHVGDSGVVLTIPVFLDGNYADLADATSIVIKFQDPDSNETEHIAMGITTPTGSTTTLTTDSTVFDQVGRWRVQAVVTWPDTTETSSPSHVIDVQPTLQYI